MTLAFLSIQPGASGAPALALCRLRPELTRVRGGRRANDEDEEKPSDGQAPSRAEHRVGHKIRQVTDVHSNWSSQGPLENGKFSYQLILDNGAEEALIMPTADDAKVLRDFFHDADSVYWVELQRFGGRLLAN